MPHGVERTDDDVLPIVMLKRLLALFEGAPTPDDETLDPLQRATAVLLVMAAQMDGHMGQDERDSIERLLQTRLGIEQASALVDEAEQEAAASTDFYAVTRVLKDQLDDGQRAAVVEMLWHVVLADGEVHDYEANLVRRVAGLLHVTDRDAGEARKRASDAETP